MKKPINFVIAMSSLFFILGLFLWHIAKDTYEAVLWRDSLWCLSAALAGYAYGLSKKGT